MEKYVYCARYAKHFTSTFTKRHKSYKETLNNPLFPITMTKPLNVDNKFHELWQTDFDNQLDARNVSKSYIIHDGPPYANGAPHMGHALNKILKDITVRTKLLEGYRVQYRPGWDCHGLPIELKAVGARNDTHSNPLHVRQKARSVAEQFIAVQSKAFQSWGVTASWQNSYFTYDYHYQAAEMKAFAKLHDKGLIKRDMYPVHWSYSTKTALAEAELEYNENHKSTSAFVTFKLSKPSLPISSVLKDIKNVDVSLVIWTTTPWTLIANEAVAVHPNIMYHLLMDKKSTNCFYVCCSEFQTKLETMLGCSLVTIAEFNGEELVDSEYRHPLIAGKKCPILSAQYVTIDKGSGLVHVAPCHGKDDFELGQNTNLPINLLVNEEGRYTSEAGSELQGLFILGDGGKKVLDLLGNHLIHTEEIVHSYPYDWRSKRPVITRLSEQWFIDTEKLRDSALTAYEDVEVFPSNMKDSMRGFIANRPRWCISRQRVWGVPIPVLFHKGRPIIDKEFILYLSDRVSKEGSDIWWKEPLENILPPDFLQKHDISSIEDLQKGQDIFDIWLDSGLSWLSVLGDNQPADLYLEGQDQFRGWFSSSLLLGVALNGSAPYKSIVVHGFTTDESGRKMSKSLGNVVDPQEIVSRFGVDVLRYWAATSGLGKSGVGEGILNQYAGKYKALRNMYRFLLGNLASYKPDVNLTFSNTNLLPLDRYLLGEVASFHTLASQSLATFQYDRILPELEHLTAIVSNLYFTAVKDRLYCDVPSSKSRLSAQHVLYLTLSTFNCAIAPILPHLVQEVLPHIPSFVSSHQSESTTALASIGNLLTDFYSTHYSNDNCDVASLKKAVEEAIILRDVIGSTESVMKLIGSQTKAANPVASLSIDIVPQTEDMFNLLQLLHPTSPDTPNTSSFSSLCELLRCSCVSLHPPGSPLPQASSSITIDSVSHLTLAVTARPVSLQCPRCRRYTKNDKDISLCNRCEDVITMSNTGVSNCKTQSSSAG